MVKAQEGEHSYLVEVKPGFVLQAHRSALKLHVPDKFSGSPVKLFFHRRTSMDMEGAPDEWVVEKILGRMENGFLM